VLFPGEAGSAPASTAAGATTAPPAVPLPQTTTAALEDYAGFWKRVAAYILDAIILYIPSMLLEKMFGGDAAQEAYKLAVANAAGDMHAIQAAQLHHLAVMWPATLLGIVIAWAYFALCESSAWQATIGKLALGIRVTDLQGERISLPRALGRYPAKVLSALILGIGFLMVAWTGRNQGLHDMIVGTLVLNGRASEFKSSPTSTGGNNSFSA
jgi:uncharacterized RDD family membrane protein YckC